MKKCRKLYVFIIVCSLVLSGCSLLEETFRCQCCYNYCPVDEIVECDGLYFCKNCGNHALLSCRLCKDKFIPDDSRLYCAECIYDDVVKKCGLCSAYYKPEQLYDFGVNGLCCANCITRGIGFQYCDYCEDMKLASDVLYDDSLGYICMHCIVDILSNE